MISLAGIDPELVRRLDRSGPRYTSYPTAVDFRVEVGEAQYRLHLAQVAERAEPLSLYVHVPFCAEHCHFCACHVIATPHRQVATAYLDDLDREFALTAAALGGRHELAQLHWGGGTPTYLAADELERLFGAIAERFSLAAEAELAIEVDPRVTSLDQLETLARLGFNRLSIGVQDFDPTVQLAIGRVQSYAITRELIVAARQLGFAGGVNLDLVYGLPHQNLSGFSATLEQVLELRPDRIALYSFAYVPWVRPRQKRLDAAAFPAREGKLELQLLALDTLLGAGYEPIGMDHFALPHDELAQATRDGELGRNFMGYTVRPTATTVAFGVSGIGEVAGGFFQNERKLSSYRDQLAAGRLPVQRGYVLDGDDLLRQYVIRQLMCNFMIDKNDVALRFGVAFDRTFAGALAQLDELRSAGLVAEDEHTLRVIGAGRLFVRNVCMAFDRYLESRLDGSRRAFSRTV